VTSLLALLFAAQSPEACEHAQTQLAMNQCAFAEFEQADLGLNAAWRHVLAYVRASDRDGPFNSDGRPSGEAKLRDAQRAWITFRDAHCAVHSYEARGGSMEPQLYESCRAEVTNQRTRQLRSLILGQ
jgi:uncharacterized protein YecT (DUF1311 family)